MIRANVNSGDAPNEAVPVAAGVYDATFEEAPTLQSPKKDPERDDMVVAVHTITEEGSEFKGRKMTSYHALWMDLGKISFKRLCLACGLTPGKEGVDLAELVGRAHKIQVTERTYKDDEGIERRTSNVKDFIVESGEP